jgi:hypothetical protein
VHVDRSVSYAGTVKGTVEVSRISSQVSFEQDISSSRTAASTTSARPSSATQPQRLEMGGSIFPGTVRLSLSAYKAFKSHVLSALSSSSASPGQLDRAFSPSALAVPPYLSHKTSFGDLDVIAGAEGWSFARDGSADWVEGAPPVSEDGVGGRTHDWAQKLGAVRWQRRGPM